MINVKHPAEYYTAHRMKNLFIIIKFIWARFQINQAMVLIDFFRIDKDWFMCATRTLSHRANASIISHVASHLTISLSLSLFHSIVRYLELFVSKSQRAIDCVRCIYLALTFELSFSLSLK